MMLNFFMPMKPPTVTHQEKKWTVRGGKPVSYEPAELKAARSKLMAHLGQYRPERPLEGPVQLQTAWFFPTAKGHRDMDPKTTKPDTDNLQKLLKDCMTDLHFWHDDAQVYSETVRKFWADVPGIAVSVEEVNNPD